MGDDGRASLRAAVGAAIVALWLLWWAPTGLLFVLRLLLGRLRFHLALGLGRALVGAGMVGAGRAVFGHEARRCRTRAAALHARRR